MSFYSFISIHSRAWFLTQSRCSVRFVADGEEEKCQKIRTFMPKYTSSMKLFVINEGGKKTGLLRRITTYFATAGRMGIFLYV